jgi:hypothetical protein
MRTLSFVFALLLGISLVFAAPVVDSGLQPRGDSPGWDQTTKFIVAKEYTVTEDDFLYEVDCDHKKWGKTCDYKVKLEIGKDFLIGRPSTSNFESTSISFWLR